MRKASEGNTKDLHDFQCRSFQTINKVPPHGGNFFKEVKKTKRKKEMNVE